MSSIATSYKRAGSNDGYDAIVIGSGIGGLTTAALLSRLAGLRVLVLERHYEPVGFTHTFKRPRFEWDVGVHYIGSTHPKTLLGKMLGLITDGTLEWEDMGEVYDRLIFGEDSYDLPKGKKALKASLVASFPDDEDAIDEYFELLKKAIQSSGLHFLEKALPPSLADLVGPKITAQFDVLASKTTREVLEGITQNERLIAVLTGQWGDYGLPPSKSSFAIHAMVASHYFHGAYYPVGGSARIAESIIPVIEAGGGRVLIRAEVEEILVEDGRAVGVRMADDSEILAPIIISGAGVFNTYHRMLAPDVARKYGVDRVLQKVEPSAAHLCLYMGLEQTAEELGLSKPNLWVYPDDKLEANLAAANADPANKLPVVYLSFPSAKDPDFENRFPGRSTIEAITIMPYSWVKKWENTEWKKRGKDYEAFKEEMAQRLMEVLFEQHPQLRGKISFYELSTPLTTQHFAGYQHGEIYGIDHTPARFTMRELRPQTPIAGLYLTGQDVATCGVAGGLFGGVLSAVSVLRKPNLLMRVAAYFLQR